MERIVGTLKEIGVISGELSAASGISADLNIPDIVFTPYPAYTGETLVIPKAFEESVLETALKTVYSNITVTEIPYTEVSNPSGGLTVSIG